MNARLQLDLVEARQKLDEAMLPKQLSWLPLSSRSHRRQGAGEKGEHGMAGKKREKTYSI